MNTPKITPEMLEAVIDRTKREAEENNPLAKFLKQFPPTFDRGWEKFKNG